jgi:tRNA(fMet)-specific endonuclease VapC
MVYLLDTNACINYLNVRHSPIERRMVVIQPGDVVICSVVLAELFRGAYRSTQRQKNLELLNRFASQFRSLPFDNTAAEIYGRIRADLEVIGMLIGPYDLQIAAIALANNLTLVTHNTREFGRINGLRLEDWEIAS